jgi:RNA polymerase primary sigma factor
MTFYLREIGKLEVLTAQQELELLVQIRQGNRLARERLIKANLRRVAEISRRFESAGLSLLELISEGNLGLLKAIERFDPSTGEAFSTRSAWWIEHAIKRALASHLSGRSATPITLEMPEVDVPIAHAQAA